MVGHQPTRRRGSRSGAAALEFGLVAVPFVALVLVILELGYTFYSQEMLDYATQTAARQIQIGAAQSSPLGPAEFIQQSICNTLSGLLPCNNVALSSQIVTNFYTQTVAQVPTNNGAFNSAALSFCVGQPGQFVLLTTYFPASAVVTPYLPITTVTVNGAPVNMIVSTAAFMNEQYTSSGYSGC